MVQMFRNSMALRHGLANIELVEMDSELKKTRVDPQDFLKDLDLKLDRAQRKSTSRPISKEEVTSDVGLSKD